MSSNDTEYYRQRALDERARAMQSSQRAVREIHLELARQYQALVGDVDLRPRVASAG